MTFSSFYNSLTLLQLQEALSLLVEGKGFTISDLRKEVPSDRNREFLKIRQTEGRSGSKLIDLYYEPKNDSLVTIHQVTPTYEDKVKIVDSNGKVKEGEEYIVRLQFEEFTKNVGKLKEFLQMTPGEQVELIKGMIEKATVKVDSNDLSWIFQGSWENSDKLGFAIRPFPKGVPNQKGIWANRHRPGEEIPALYVTKHILEVVNTIPFLASTIAKMIRGKYGEEST